MEAQEILGLDLGQKHTGIARASNVARLAEPLMTVPTQEVVRRLNEYINDHKVEAIAIGLPRSLSSNETDQTAWIRQWVDKAKDKIKAPLFWQDEALTSELAGDNHAVAAAIILQDFMDGAEAERQLV